jgi:hypothetical protein
VELGEPAEIIEVEPQLAVPDSVPDEAPVPEAVPA